MGDELQGKLPDDFPGKTALEAAGITTYAQLRKAGDVTNVEGIGPVTKEKIDAHVAGGAQKTGTDDDKLTTLETMEVSASEMAALKGGKASPLAATGETQDQLAKETAEEKQEEDMSVYGRLSRSEYVLNENEITGERWIGLSIQRDPSVDMATKAKTKVTSIAEVRPWRGLTVKPKNGEPFAVSEEYDRDATPAAWLGMIVPSTKKNFIEAA